MRIAPATHRGECAARRCHWHITVGADDTALIVLLHQLLQQPIADHRARRFIRPGNQHGILAWRECDLAIVVALA
jgi:hypothetical protein